MHKFQSALFLTLVLLLTLSTPSLAADPYPDYDTMTAEIRTLAADNPRLVTLTEYGRSVQDRPLLALRIALPDGGPRPEALIAANIHGDEWIGNRMAMALARRLTDTSDPWIASLLSQSDYWILPCLNPDGYVATQSERPKPKPTRKTRHNAHGVDLNRNFPLPATRTVHIPMAGVTDPDSPYYAGPAPYSEPETAAVRDFLRNHRFYAAVDLHSAWGTIFPPRCNDTRCVRDFRRMFQPALARQKRLYALGIAPQVDTFTGEMEDALYYDFGIMAACWEISFLADGKQALAHTGLWFHEQNPPDPNPWITNDRDPILTALAEALSITNGNPLPPDRLKNRTWK